MRPIPEYQDLFEIPSNTELTSIPTELWFLQVVEIIICLEGQHYLVLEYPFYAPNNAENQNIVECIWSPPYSGYKLNVGAKRLRRVEQIKHVYKQFLIDKKNEIEESLQYKLYFMGLGDYELIENGELLEYKQSIRDPGKWKCYYIKRYGLINLGRFDLLNMADPECIKSYSYLSIEHYNEVTILDEKTDVRYFRGKPLASNTHYLFKNRRIQAIVNDSNTVDKSLLTYKENGLLFSFDLISFGKNQEQINDSYKTINRVGKEIADDFEFMLNNIFGIELNSNNFNQYRLMGDGFIAASPIRHNILSKTKSDDVVIEDQIKLTLTMITKIFSRLAQLAPNLPQQFSCRCSLLLESYFFGKIGGLICDKAEIGGRSVLKLERLQGIINGWLLESGQKDTGFCYFAVEKEFFYKFESAFKVWDFEQIGYDGAYKEYTNSVFIIKKKIK